MDIDISMQAFKYLLKVSFVFTDKYALHMKTKGNRIKKKLLIYCFAACYGCL